MPEYNKQPRRKFCQFCKDKAEYIDYKDTQMLRKYVTDRGKIKPRRVTGAISRTLLSAPVKWLSCHMPCLRSAVATIVAIDKRRFS